jgi:hypothetical protein
MMLRGKVGGVWEEVERIESLKWSGYGIEKKILWYLVVG